MNNLNWKSYIFGTIFSGISRTISNLYNIVGIVKGNDAINEILFYGAQEDKLKKQTGLNNLFCIYYMLFHANQSIDICVPTLNSDTISKCLINVQEKNATVKIIVHNSGVLKNMQLLIVSGIEVMVINPKIKLEHEFLLIDANSKDAVAILGSLDYEVNNVNHNMDKTLLTSETALIQTLKREFDRIWNTEKAIPLDSFPISEEK